MTELHDLRELLRNHDKETSDALEGVLGHESQEWLTVLEDRTEDDGPRCDVLRIACLLRPERVDDALLQAGFDFSGEGHPGFVGRPDGSGDLVYIYETVDQRDEVALVFHRVFNGPFPKVGELAEDFRLFWDLYEDRVAGTFATTDELGDVVVVARWIGDRLEVRKSYLRRYQAARQLALSIQLNVDRRGGPELEDLVDQDIRIASASVNVHFYGGRLTSDPETPNYTRLVGKVILAPPPVANADVWPYAKPARYETFTIALDGEGEPVEHTCDPDALANFYGANPGAPNYLTPVFFQASVLDKYFADPDRYNVGDGLIRSSGAWVLRIDNGLPEYVAVFLGDLGGDLPYREQQYWKAFNIPPPGPLSETAIRRSFLGQWAESGKVEHRFQAAYIDLNAAWDQQHGWPLFKPLNEPDQHLLETTRMPTNASFAAFDTEVTKLAKLVVDSLNEQAIGENLKDVKGVKGIGKLERLLDQLDMADVRLCTTLRTVYGARSRSGAHRKGSDFDLAKLLDGAADLPALMARYLTDLTEDFDQLRGLVAPAAANPEAPIPTTPTPSSSPDVSLTSESQGDVESMSGVGLEPAVLEARRPLLDATPDKFGNP